MIHQQFYELSMFQVIFPDFWVVFRPTQLLRKGFDINKMTELNDDLSFLDVRDQKQIIKISKKNQQLWAQLKKCYNHQKQSGPKNIPYHEQLQQQQQQQQMMYLYQQQQQLYLQQMYAQQYATSGYNAGGYQNYGNQQQPYYNTQQYGQQNVQQSYAQNGQVYAGSQASTVDEYSQINQQQMAYNNQQYTQQQIQNYQQQQQGGYDNQGYNVNQGHYVHQHHNHQNYHNKKHNYHNNSGYNNMNYNGNGNAYEHHNNYNQGQQRQYMAKNSAQVNGNINKAQTIEQAKVDAPAAQVKKQQEKKPEPPAPVKLQKKKLTIQEIRKLINATNPEQLKASVNIKLLEQIQESKKWKKTVQIVPAVQQNKGNKKGTQKDIQKGGNTNKNNYTEGNQNQGGQFVRGKNFVRAPTINTGPTFDIQIGKNQNLQTRLIKNKLKQKAAQGNFNDKKQQQLKSMSEIDRIKRDIIFNLNRVAPQNVKDIYQQIQNFALEDKQVCNVLVQSIIQKAWEQPKYAACYAKLSSYFAKIDPNRFKFELGERKQKKNNFKYILIDKVQHSFDKKDRKDLKKDQVKPQQQSKQKDSRTQQQKLTDAKKEEEDQKKYKYAKDFKTLLLGNVKFIAELIKIKLIPKKTINYCISQLLQFFFNGFFDYHKNKNVDNNYYEYYFESLIEFLQNLGEKYESIDQKQKGDKGKKGQEQDRQEEGAAGNESKIQIKLKQISSLTKSYAQIEGLGNLKANQYFELFKTINNLFLKQVRDGSRLSALLQNLEERRFNNWKKHNVSTQGPKKLKDLKNDDEPQTAEQKTKAELALLDDKMAKLLKRWVQNQNKWSLQELSALAGKFKIEDLVGAYLKYVADDKKDLIPRRMQLFDIILDKYLGERSFKKIWQTAFGNVALLVSQFPFCASVLAKFLILYQSKKGGKLVDFYIKYDEDDQEDEYFLMNEVFQKAYHYSQNEDLKKVITPKAKLSHLL